MLHFNHTCVYFRNKKKTWPENKKLGQKIVTSAVKFMRKTCDHDGHSASSFGGDVRSETSSGDDRTYVCGGDDGSGCEQEVKRISRY